MDPIHRATDNVTTAVLSTERDGRRQWAIDLQTEKVYRILYHYSITEWTHFREKVCERNTKGYRMSGKEKTKSMSLKCIYAMKN